MFEIQGSHHFFDVEEPFNDVPPVSLAKGCVAGIFG
jgi:hypothetical protein